MSEERLEELQGQLQGAMTYMATKRRRPQMLEYIDRLKAEIRSLGTKPGQERRRPQDAWETRGE